MFLYQEVLEQPLERGGEAVRARRGRHLSVVLMQEGTRSPTIRLGVLAGAA